MATDVILPALGMSQDTGKIVQWLKEEGEQVEKGMPLVEIETDKATVEIESPAEGVLAHIAASEGDDVPVGQVIARILAPGERSSNALRLSTDTVHNGGGQEQEQEQVEGQRPPVVASPLASRIAAEHHVDVSQVKPAGRRVQKADVLAYLQEQNKTVPTKTTTVRLAMASPKARRLASEQGKDLRAIQGSGPGGAVLAADVLAAAVAQVQVPFAPLAREQQEGVMNYAPTGNGVSESVPGNIWRIMAERTTQSWTSVPHFYLMREVNASRLIAWREQVLKRSASAGKVTFTDLLVKIVAAALRLHPRLNASWSEGKIVMQQEVHVGLAVAVEDGLVVPVIHTADTLGLSEIAQRRAELVAKAQAGKLRPEDISNGTFTISNLGMYNVDAFNAIINAPQAAILAVGRIAERVVPVNGQPAVQPMMVLTLSCDHRVVDGARGAQFLDRVASLIEEPLGLLG